MSIGKDSIRVQEEEVREPLLSSTFVHTDTLLTAGLASGDTKIQDTAANGILAALEALDKKDD